MAKRNSVEEATEALFNAVAIIVLLKLIREALLDAHTKKGKQKQKKNHKHA